MAEKLRLAIVGAGAVARDYSAALPQVADTELIAVVDRIESARQRAAGDFGLPTYGSVRELLADHTIDAALVLTPPAEHEPVTMELLGEGVAVLCEKPISTALGPASRMFQFASRARVPLMMASKFRYVPDVVEARQLIAAGAIGDVVLFDNSFCSRVDMSQRWNSVPAISGGGVLIDNGTHSVDIARYLFGPIVRVWAHFGRRTQAVGVEDTVRLMVETGRAAVGFIDLSWSLDGGNDYYVRIQGTRGTVQIGWRGSRYRQADGEWQTFGCGYDKRLAFARQLGNFADVVRGDDSPLVTSEDALESVRAIEAAYRAARVGRWVPLHVAHAGSY